MTWRHHLVFGPFMTKYLQQKHFSNFLKICYRSSLLKVIRQVQVLWKLVQ